MVNYRIAFSRNPTFAPYHCAQKMPVQFTGNSVMRMSKIQGQIVEYHETYCERVCNHIPSPPTADQVKTRLNQELETQGVDGWSEKVTVVQSLTQDSVHFRTYAAATGTVEESPAIPVIIGVIIIALIAAITITVVAFAWLAYSLGHSVLERFRHAQERIDRFFDELGQVWDTVGEVVDSIKQRFWMVCEVCGLGFAPFTDYATYEDIPEAIKQAFRDHSRICRGFLPPTPPVCEDYATQAECEAGGCYWYDGVCYATPQEGCTTDVDCPAGYKCVDRECVRKACSDYTTQADCEDAGCFWYNEACHAVPRPRDIWPFPILSRLAEWFPSLRRFLPS